MKPEEGVSHEQASEAQKFVLYAQYRTQYFHGVEYVNFTPSLT